MTDRLTPPTAPPNFETALDEAADRLADGLTDNIHHALTDPIMRLLLAADGVETDQFVSMMHRLAQRLRLRPRPRPRVEDERSVTAAP